MGACDAIWTFETMVLKDTIINSMSYKVINSPFTNEYGYVREDSLSGKVWVFNEEANKDFFVMDLSLSKGDSFKIQYSLSDSVFTHVDTVFIKDGLKHIVFKDWWIQICSGSENLEFIEGTGTNAGFFYSNHFDTYLLCNWKDGVKIYGNQIYSDSCYVNEVNIPDHVINNNLLFIFPNPANEFVTMQFPNESNEIIKIEIYNSIGRISRMISTFNSEITIYIGDLPLGIYYIQVSKSGIPYKTGKLLNYELH
jgi:hypothetical protein